MPAAVLAAVFSVAMLGAAPARADEVQITTNAVVDYEFNAENDMIAWVDVANNLWLGNVDPNTGNFVPDTGRGIQVDTNAATAPTFGNGPEWVHSSSGWSVVYTRFVAGTTSDSQPSTAYISIAKQTDFGWLGTPIPGTMSMVDQIGNVNPTQADPPIVFRRGTDDSSPLYIQGINDSAPVEVPDSTDSSGSQVLVQGLPYLIYTHPVVYANGNSARQIFIYNYQTNTSTQISTDYRNKGAVGMWFSPEYNAYLIWAIANSNTIMFYRQVNATTWTAIASIPTPTGAPQYIWSPDIFVYKGKSYLFMVRSPSVNPEQLYSLTQIWITSLDQTVNREVSDSAGNAFVRQDPEYFITSSGPYIYYNCYTPAVFMKSQAQSMGVWRASTGL